MAHTPGPWRWYWRQEDYEANCGVFHEERKGMARSVCRAPRYETQEKWEANASLIAAAPELLHAAREALDLIGDQNDAQSVDTANLLRAAIAKATGEQQ